MKSSVAVPPHVSPVTAPVVELTVVVPAAVQFQVGADAKLDANWTVLTLTEGGRAPLHVCPPMHIAPQLPQLSGSFKKSEHPPLHAV